MRLIVILAIILIPSMAQAIEWPHGYRGAVSITADDAYPSQFKQADILEQYGFRGTWNLTSLKGAYKWQWRQLSREGHEIGNHTYLHKRHVIWQSAARSVGNQEWWLQKNIGSKRHSFAYPRGDDWIGYKYNKQYATVGTCQYYALLSAVVPAARRLGETDNIPEDVAANRYRINSFSMVGSSAVDKAVDAIDRAQQDGTWVVLSFHSLDEQRDPFRVSEEDYRFIIQYLFEQNIWVAPFIEVFDYILANTPERSWTCT